MNRLGAVGRMLEKEKNLLVLIIINNLKWILKNKPSVYLKKSDLVI